MWWPLPHPFSLCPKTSYNKARGTRLRRRWRTRARTRNPSRGATYKVRSTCLLVLSFRRRREIMRTGLRVCLDRTNTQHLVSRGRSLLSLVCGRALLAPFDHRGDAASQPASGDAGERATTEISMPAPDAPVVHNGCFVLSPAGAVLGHRRAAVVERAALGATRGNKQASPKLT